MEFDNIYTHWLEMICMEQWVRTIIQWLSKWLGTSVQIYRNYKTCHQILKANVTEYVYETTSLMWIWNEGDEQPSRGR